MWPLLNVVFGLIVAGILAYRLAIMPQTLTGTERAGIGLIGAAMILTIAPIVSASPTPYEDWGGLLLRIGCAIFFVGQMIRHYENNQAMIRQARKHKRSQPHVDR